jgi:integrase
MKAAEAHRVYLSPRAVEIIRAQKRDASDRAIVFESPMKEGAPLSNMAMLVLLRRMGLQTATTVHGLCRHFQHLGQRSAQIPFGCD